MKKSNTPIPSATAAPWVFVAIGAVLLFVLLFSVMLFQAERLVGLGLAGQMWFLLLLVLGLAAAVALFAISKSQAIYKGKVWNGTLELRGPGVLMLVIVVAGHWLVPAPAVKFDVTVLLQGEVGARDARPLRGRGQLTLDLGSDQRTEAVGDKGEVRFMALPADQRGKTVGVLLQGADAYELAASAVTLDAEAVRLGVRARVLPVHGEVVDARGRPVAQAAVRVAQQQVSTDGAGRFTLQLPADLPDGERGISISAPGLQTWRGSVVPGGGLLSVRLEAAR